MIIQLKLFIKNSLKSPESYLSVVFLSKHLGYWTFQSLYSTNRDQCGFYARCINDISRFRLFYTSGRTVGNIESRRSLFCLNRCTRADPGDRSIAAGIIKPCFWHSGEESLCTPIIPTNALSIVPVEQVTCFIGTEAFWKIPMMIFYECGLWKWIKCQLALWKQNI